MLIEVIVASHFNPGIKRLMPCNQQFQHSLLQRREVVFRLIVVIQTTDQADAYALS